MIFSEPSEGIKELCQYMIENPHDWIQTNYEFRCISQPDLRIWTNDGIYFIQISGNDCLNLREKLLISSSIKKSIANRFLEKNKK